MAPSTASAQTFFSHLTIKASTTGILASSANAAGAISAFVSDTSVTQAGGGSAIGISAVVPGGKPGVSVFLNRINAAYNNTGVAANGAGASVQMGNSVVFANGNGVSQIGGGSVTSFKNNEISSNGVDGTPLTQIPLN